MLRSFFKVAFRFFWRNKSYTVLNYLCLTFGLTCAIVAALNINRVTGYDRFHANYDRLYEVEANVTYFNGDQFPKELLSASLPDVLKENVPEIETFTRIVFRDYTFINRNESFSESGIHADPEFLDIFSFPLASGPDSDVLSENNSIVISERMAIKFFKTTDCIGETLTLKEDSGQEVFTITGIMTDVPSQSYLRFDFIIPFSKFLSANPRALEIGATSCQTWALLSENADVSAANEKMKNLIREQETTLNQELFLFPLKEKILYYYSGGRRIWREMRNLVLIGSIGFAILLIACFNFINLTIALNIKRYREAGIKKVVGARKSDIIYQHLGETFLLTFLSLITSIDLVSLSVGVLNRAFNGDVQFDFTDFRIIIVFGGIAFFTGIASGLLPAIYLSSSKPVNVLKGRILTSSSFSAFRQGLIVFQFTIPIVLIIFVLIVKVQDGFFRNYDLGFDKDRLMIISGLKENQANPESIRADLLSIPGIEAVSFSNCVPARGATVTNEVSWEGKDPTQEIHFWSIKSDFDYDKVVKLKISDGRYFDRSYPSDSAGFVINDIAAKVLSYDNPVGRTITLDGKKGTIVGVFRDFHTIDLTGPYTPTIISLSGEGNSNLLISIEERRYADLLGKVKEVIGKYETESTFQASLYSDMLKRTELTTVSNLVGLAFVVSILLACLGLSGLASFTAESRTKEIGIRKINGASVFSIIKLLGLNYLKWMIIASIISVPLAFILGNIFLSRFNFRTQMPYWAFIAGPVISCAIALAAICWQSWRAATRNPAEALRYE
ncbi:MAG: ABC transporter permease [Bacteroidales bacterium]|jgi:ABC-type antimicrobial peptide transport system permease subunit|nr:ABC transporter permease [Bacteroidales bacterium]